MNQRPAVGSSATSIFDSSSRMRSALMICRRSRIDAMAASIAASGSKPSVATKRAARSMRSGSSPNEISGSIGVRSRCIARSPSPPDGIDELRLVERERQGVHREVAPQQVGLDVVRERHLGLAALRVVHVGAERRDLEGLPVLDAADGPEALALQPHRVGPGRDDARDRVRAGVGRDVDVVAVVVPIEERVAHDAADEVGAEALRAQPPRELLGRGVLLEEPRQPRRKVHACILAVASDRGSICYREKRVRTRRPPRPAVAPPASSSTARSSGAGRAGSSTPTWPRAAR